jgi:hypothetical protein
MAIQVLKANSAKVADFGDTNLLQAIGLARILFGEGHTTSPGWACVWCVK